METVIDPMDEYIIEYEKCKLIRLCMLDKINEKCSIKDFHMSIDEEIHLNEIITDTTLKYTYLQLVEEFKKLCKL